MVSPYSHSVGKQSHNWAPALSKKLLATDKDGSPAKSYAGGYSECATLLSLACGGHVLHKSVPFRRTKSRSGPEWPHLPRRDSNGNAR